MFARKDGVKKVVADVASIHDLITTEHPGLPIILFGQSEGGLIALSFLRQRLRPVAGAAIWNYPERQPLSMPVARLLLGWELCPESISLEGGLDRQALLIGIGVVAVLFLVLFFVGDSEDEAEGRATDYTVPVAGGFPVPPMPGGGPVRGAAQPLVFERRGEPLVQTETSTSTQTSTQGATDG